MDPSEPPAHRVWVDLLDPTRDEIAAAVGTDLHDTAWERILAPSDTERRPRPRLRAHDGYVFGLLLVPINRDGQVTFREVDVVATGDTLVTIRKSPAVGEPFACDATRHSAEQGGAGVGLSLYLLVDDVAEQFLDLIDSFDDEIDQLEDNIDAWASEDVRTRISELRHDILHVRNALGPTRDLARAVLDDRVELEGVEMFPRDVELRFADAYDKLLRASDGLDLARDLLSGVRDFHQAQVAIEQNEVTKRLTVVASMLLVPTFIVGVYGQNLKGVPEFGFRYGYAFSWFLIVATSIGQFIYFRRKRWI